MPVVSSNYWNMVYGRLSGEAKEDVECLSTMRQLARNMTFLIRASGRERKIRFSGRRSACHDQLHPL